MRKLVFGLLILVSVVVNAQLRPDTYKFENGRIGKIAADSPISNSILDIAIDGSDIWLGTSRGLSYSADLGATWKNYYQDETFGEESITAIGVYNGVVYASTGHSTERNGESLPEGSGIKISTDGGNTWISRPQPVDDPADSSVQYGINTLRALPVTVEINNIVYDMAFTPGTIWIVTFAGGLRKSTDLGETWQRVVLPPDNIDYLHPDSTYSFSLQPVAGGFGSESYLNHRVFSVAAAGDNVIYVGTAGGINKGTILADGNIVWQKSTRTNQDEPISGNFVTALSYDENTNSVWGATWLAEGTTEYYGVSASFDGGLSWKVFLSGEKAHNFGFVPKISGSNIFTDIMAATDNGLFRSADFGNSWFTPQNIIDVTNGNTLKTDKYYSASALNFSGLRYVFLGSAEEGLIKLEESGSMWSGDWYILTASEKIVAEDNTYAFPNPFSPSQERVRIKYLNNSSSTVTIRILDFGMNLVKTVIQNADRLQGVEHTDYWDGRDEFGSVVANGVYFYRIDFGDSDPVYGKIMVLR
ncbi:MAG: hypothetical protein SCALA702_12380 [Melioribacteraceae bacterium]|nr:MAG: hypothetical protein SCALA702_12380 [Melioribacteraceae bacterium]